MSTIEFQCPGCSRRFSVPADQAGRKGGCRHCNIFFLIPAASSTIAAPPAPALARPLISGDPLQARPANPEPPTIYIPDRPGRSEPRRLAAREAPAPAAPALPTSPEGGGPRVWITLVVVALVGVTRWASHRETSQREIDDRWRTRSAEDVRRLEDMLRRSREEMERARSSRFRTQLPPQPDPLTEALDHSGDRPRRPPPAIPLRPEDVGPPVTPPPVPVPVPAPTSPYMPTPPGRR